jgi:hypothetical protein
LRQEWDDVVIRQFDGRVIPVQKFVGLDTGWTPAYDDGAVGQRLEPALPNE